MDWQGFTSSEPVIISTTLTPYLKAECGGRGKSIKTKGVHENIYREKEQTPSLGITQGNSRELQHINPGYINTLIKARV